MRDRNGLGVVGVGPRGEPAEHIDIATGFGRRIVVARRYNEWDIDFDAIDADLAKLVPPSLSLKDVLDRLRGRLLEQQAKGVTVAQMHEVLTARGIHLGERSLKVFLEKGELPGRRAKAVAARAVGADPGADPF